MLLTDFLKAVRLIMLRRLKMDEWDVARAMSEHEKELERQFHDGASPLEAISEITDTELEEYFGDPNFDPLAMRNVEEQAENDHLLLPSLKGAQA